MEPEIFISYSHRDEQEALNIVSKLESYDLKCWISKRNIISGNYAEQIIKSINNCKVFVLIYSANSNESEHVRNEIDKAFRKNIPIIPFRLDNTTPNEDFDYYLGRKLWIEAYPNKEKQIKKLADAVIEVLKKCSEKTEVNINDYNENDDIKIGKRKKMKYILASSIFFISVIILIYILNIFKIRTNYSVSIKPEMIFVEGGTLIFNEDNFGINAKTDTVVLNDFYIGKY